MSDDLIERLLIKGALDREMPNHTHRRWQIERIEAADAIARLRAEVERLNGVIRAHSYDYDRAIDERNTAEAALADERRHADVLAEALTASAGCLDGFPGTVEAYGVDLATIRAAKSAEDYDESLGEAIIALDQHRARRQSRPTAAS